MHYISKIAYSCPIILLLSLALTLFSCDGEDGDIGPTGEVGDQGEKGTKGITGEDGLYHIGTFEGTINGTYPTGEEFQHNFSYEYSATPYDRVTSYGQDSHRLEFRRFNTPSSQATDYSRIILRISDLNTDEEYMYTSDFNLYALIPMEDGTWFEFDSYYNENEDSFDIFNYHYNQETAEMSFNFLYLGENGNNSTNNSVEIFGTFKSGGKVYKEVNN